jgi:hypothetical protein
VRVALSTQVVPPPLEVALEAEDRLARAVSLRAAVPRQRSLPPVEYLAPVDWAATPAQEQQRRWVEQKE